MSQYCNKRDYIEQMLSNLWTKCQSESVSIWRDLDHGTLFSTYISYHSNNKTNVLPTFQLHNLLTAVDVFYSQKKLQNKKKR